MPRLSVRSTPYLSSQSGAGTRCQRVGVGVGAGPGTPVPVRRATITTRYMNQSGCDKEQGPSRCCGRRLPRAFPLSLPDPRGRSDRVLREDATPACLATRSVQMTSDASNTAQSTEYGVVVIQSQGRGWERYPVERTSKRAAEGICDTTYSVVGTRQCEVFRRTTAELPVMRPCGERLPRSRAETNEGGAISGPLHLLSRRLLCTRTCRVHFPILSEGPALACSFCLFPLA